MPPPDREQAIKARRLASFLLHTYKKNIKKYEDNPVQRRIYETRLEQMGSLKDIAKLYIYHLENCEENKHDLLMITELLIGAIEEHLPKYLEQAMCGLLIDAKHAVKKAKGEV